VKKSREYVLGFVTDGETVALLYRHPSRPEQQWQKGLLNGIGGGIEDGETPRQAMRRECAEELGIMPPISDWHQFATLGGTNDDGTEWVVHCFVVRVVHPKGGYRAGIEEVVLVKDCELRELKVIPNLHWLIPMAHVHQLWACKETSHYRITEQPVSAERDAP
jgi:8-oxo-dGTP diphosphatase